MDRRERRQTVSVYDLVKLAEELGYTPILVGRNYYTLKEHDSVRIRVSDNTFKRYSNGVGGDSVSFLMEFAIERSNKFKSVDYCVMWLEHKLNVNNTFKADNTKKYKKKELVLPEKDDNYRRVYAYLLKTRFIDKEIVNMFVQRKMIYQEKNRKNLVFVGHNENGKPVYAMQRSTIPGNRFMMEIQGNNYDYGIVYDNESADTLFVTESVIDMMSLMSLYAEKDFHKKHSFLAICGVEKDESIYKYLQTHSNIKDVILALDNDLAGKNATKKIVDTLNKSHKTIKHMVIVPKSKDWNEDLVKKNKSLEVNYGNTFQKTEKDDLELR